MPKLHWDCEKLGCFNRVKRPKIEVFDECFSRGSAFGDVDGIIDNAGKAFLLLEWKSKSSTGISTGQKLLYKGLTSLSPAITVVVVFGDAESMTVNAVQVIRNGVVEAPQKLDLEGLKSALRSWWIRTSQQVRHSAPTGTEGP